MFSSVVGIAEPPPGTISKSVSITADAFNNLSDAGSSAVTLLGFRLAEKAVSAVFPDVKTAPYLMTAASDSRFLDESLTPCALRFTPFLISDEQLASIHGIDENVDLSVLAPAVDFYRYVMKEASHA